jgi:hypothetical protein
VTGAISATLSVNFLESVIKGVRFAADSALEGESGARSATSISGRSVTRIITRRSFRPGFATRWIRGAGGQASASCSNLTLGRRSRAREWIAGRGLYEQYRGQALPPPPATKLVGTWAQLPAELTEERAWHDRQRDYRPEGRVATRRPQASRRRGLAMRRRPTHCNAPPFPHMRRQGCNRAAPYGHSTRLESDRSS